MAKPIDRVVKALDVVGDKPDAVIRLIADKEAQGRKLSRRDRSDGGRVTTGAKSLMETRATSRDYARSESRGS